MGLWALFKGGFVSTITTNLNFSAFSQFCVHVGAILLTHI